MTAESGDVFDRPVIILAAPRSGSTLLFETLAEAPDVWTIGDESHGVIEGLEPLRPGGGRVDSNRLDESHAAEPLLQAVRARFAGRLRDRDGRQPTPGPPVPRLRFLEKTPKNALRLPFLTRVFPDALYVFLVREPRPNIGSMIEAWKSGRWVTYPELDGWQGPPWSLLLPPGWQALDGHSIAEICAWQWATANRVIADDLATLPRERWTACEYAELVKHPEATVRRICDFAGLEVDQRLLARFDGELPLSRYTQSAPDPDKWRANEADIEPLIAPGHPFGVIRTWRRCRRLAMTA